MGVSVVLLREFLYVDVSKVRGLMAQLDDGILESTVSTESSKKTTGGGVKGFASHEAEWGDTNQATKSKGDALFSTLESALESEGLLSDISDLVIDSSLWLSGGLRENYPAGSLVRITCNGHLFDSRFVARTFANFAATAVGLQNLDAMDSSPSQTPLPPQAKKAGGAGQKGPKLPKRAVPADWSPLPLEAEIPPDLSVLDGGLTGRNLQGIIQVSRGVYSPGLYLNLQPSDEKTHVVSARLEEGRSFLDSDVDVLFARYGVGFQQWSLVGTVGHHGDYHPKVDFKQGDFLDADGNVVRAAFSQFVNSFMQYLGTLGFADLVQAPAFSVVPIAVYRVLNPRQAGLDLNILH